MLNYITDRVFKFFYSKDKELAVTRTIGFLTLLEVSACVPVFIILISLVNLSFELPRIGLSLEYLIALPVTLVMIKINRHYLDRRLKNITVANMAGGQDNNEPRIPIWVILMMPFLFLFVTPIIYGYFNGSLSFPFLEK